ncbi:MAG: hypothetical protein FVQ84_08375 [Planctomycetes bacterium]|nr:hypothetical protein [Planctomycetota bacterium]
MDDIVELVGGPLDGEKHKFIGGPDMFFPAALQKISDREEPGGAVMPGAGLHDYCSAMWTRCIDIAEADIDAENEREDG